MRRTSLFVGLIGAALMTALAACEAAGTGRPAGSERTEASPGNAASSPTPASAITEGATPMPASSGAGDKECGADKLGRWLNLLPTATVRAEIAATVGERPIRYYTQGDPVTLDYSPGRLNVELGADGRIKLFRCG